MDTSDEVSAEEATESALGEVDFVLLKVDVGDNLAFLSAALGLIGTSCHTFLSCVVGEGEPP